MAGKQRQWRSAATLALLAVIMTALTTIIHELGHFAIPLTFDLPAELKPTSVSGGATPETGARGWMVAAQAGGGPLMTVVMALIGGGLFVRDRQRLWALAFAVAAVSRTGVTTGYLAIRLFFAIRGLPFGGTPNFDEHSLALATGLSPVVVSIAATAFLAFILFWLLSKVERGSRFLFALALAIGVVAGSIAWAALAPPVLITIS